MRQWKTMVAACVFAGAAACNAVAADVAAPAPPSDAGPATVVLPANYNAPSNWLCRPGREDACAVDLRSTVIAPDGSRSIEAFMPAAAPPIDCFYMYPTVSLDPTPNSDLLAGSEERATIRAQFARFAAVCRTFAPMYRQNTLAALRARMLGQTVAADRELAYADVLAAWRHYLQHDNIGADGQPRGVVLIGHSQGAGVLTRLIREEIDGRSEQARLVSALLLGTSLAVPKGADVGGVFQHVPLCRTREQTGCALAFASFRATSPPPPGSMFGQGPDGMRAACVNPAALAGGSATLHAYLSAGQLANLLPVPQNEWVRGGAAIETPFVSLPGLLSGECVEDARGSYLGVTVHGEPADPRTDDIPGDLVVGGRVLADWGLHLVDVHLVMGDLLQLVQAQGAAWTRANTPAGTRDPATNGSAGPH